MRTKRVRRGSTLVMVGIMLVAFVGVGAIAADIGRFYVVTAEVQTAADAAAIEAARKLMKTPGVTPEDSVEADVIPWVAATQRANMTALSTTPADVVMLYYTPGTNGNQGTIEVDLKGRRPNAVRVSLASTPKGFFAQLLGNKGTRLLKRSGTAWVASLGSNCVRPWAFPGQSLYLKVTGNPAPPPPADSLPAVQFSNYMNLPNSSRMFTVLGQNQTSKQPNAGEWNGFNFTGNAGKPGFQDGLQGCWSNKINPDAGQGKTLPGQANQYVNWSTQAITYSSGGGKKNGSTSGICAFLNATYTADCYAPPTSTFPGVSINTAWGQLLGNGSNGVKFDYVGQFKLLCYYSAPTDKCSNNEPGTPNTGYPEGTVVGYIEGLRSRVITPDDVLGNFASDIQTIVLVQ